MCLQCSRTAPQMGGLLAVGRITSFESTADQAVVRECCSRELLSLALLQLDLGACRHGMGGRTRASEGQLSWAISCLRAAPEQPAHACANVQPAQDLKRLTGLDEGLPPTSTASSTHQNQLQVQAKIEKQV